MKINTKKGFSLIELSIVLIIIGLLVAGITGGASLIKSAELRSTISEIRNYQTAVNAYYTAVGKLPGTINSSEMAFGDSLAAWAAMKDEGIVDLDLSVQTTTDTEGVTSNVPVSSFNSDNSPASKYKGGFYALGYNNTMLQNVVFLFATGETEDTPTTLAGSTGTNSTTSLNNASITRKDAAFIDEKMDNGIMSSGRIYSFNAGSNAGCTYTDADSTKDCALAVGIGL